MKNLLIKSAIASGVVLSLATITRPAMATSFTISIENAGVQNAQLSNFTNGYVQNFDDPTLKTGYNAAGFDWYNGGTKIGSYTKTLIVNADQYGGAGGTGKYFDVDTTRSSNGQTVSTLTLNTPQSYFGLWWSAGDASNVLTFLSGNKVVQTITTADVKSYIDKLKNKSDYYGNPTTQFLGKDSGEPFAFLNFYDVGGTFDQIQFTNIGGSGFESDNHTVATAYNSVTGAVVVKATPEPSSILGVLGIGIVGAASFITRRSKKNSVLQSS
ncbi:PEP-CTERM sorting domain-containing protein [Aetokthonos hydrillicola Thurmond2011]|uniref:PEP-CTERM sorting domain-containing protein n=1 Tax=Aetokthonos hydrillicola Thurmond2011 TaxID=2712845 RepID=A0AAP5IE90_9CYAN|nr:PEP-CTERM sorting domain-containing protein [Aetokthonos hydrillicola]MBW4588806.1 PEP-CTERM sorting domain-containing protein [Aetokthonos hydrillicola CCALA 1050]MDR9897330.1 PEP-CTERM sorting domain-containing protein [Aetokthonos hydrillicola Thurmond2011]